MTTTYERTADNLHSPDMAHEQMPPVFAWSHNYVAAALPPQQGACDTLLGQSGASVVAVRSWRRPALTGRHRRSARNDLHTATLDPGEVLELIRSRATSSSPSKEPLLMTQGIDCEPSLSLAISADKSAR